MNEAIFTPIAGALGDVLENYLDGELGYFASLKRSGATTAVKLWSVNDQAPSLFTHHPHVDHVLTQPFALARGKTVGFRAWAAAGEHAFRLLNETDLPRRWERSPFYLSPAEQVIAEDIASWGPYVAIHPSAGRPERSLVHAGLAAPLIEAASKHAERVIVLGGNSTRNDGIERVSLIERGVMHAGDRNVYDLVGKFSVRLHAHLASKATKFIGTVSAYNAVAQCCAIPSLVFGSAQNRRDIVHGGSVFAKMRANSRSRLVFLDQRPDVPALVREFLP